MNCESRGGFDFVFYPLLDLSVVGSSSMLGNQFFAGGHVKAGNLCLVDGLKSLILSLLKVR